jgi:hypothetical protein
MKNRKGMSAGASTAADEAATPIKQSSFSDQKNVRDRTYVRGRTRPGCENSPSSRAIAISFAGLK